MWTEEQYQATAWMGTFQFAGMVNANLLPAYSKTHLHASFIWLFTFGCHPCVIGSYLFECAEFWYWLTQSCLSAVILKHNRSSFRAKKQMFSIPKLRNQSCLHMKKIICFLGAPDRRSNRNCSLITVGAQPIGFVKNFYTAAVVMVSLWMR